MAENRFRPAKAFEEEEKCAASAIPKSTNIKTNGRLEFLENSRVRLPKEATLEPGGLFKNFDLHKVQSFDVPFLEMDVLCLNYWLAKFIQEVAKPSKERYPPRTMHILDCVRNTSIMEEKNANLDFILLDPSDKSCRVAFIVIICSCIVIESSWIQG